MDQNSNHPIGNICFLRSHGTDDTAAFEQALRVCHKTGASLTIVSVIEKVPEGIMQLIASQFASPETITGEAEERAECDRLQELASTRGVQANIKILHGNRSIEVCKQVLNAKHELLIKTPEPNRGIQRALVGHIDRQLIRRCPCAVWIVKPSYGTFHTRVIAAVDPAPFHEETPIDPIRNALNISIMDLALLLSAIEGAELHVVHVWSFYIETALRWRAGLGDTAVDGLGTAVRSKHETALGQLLAPYMPNITRVHLLKGHAGEEIARFCAENSSDLLVMGTMCRSGIEGFLIGNTAETLLDQANCSIVALKPATAPISAPSSSTVPTK